MAQVENILTKIERLILDANNTNTSDDSGKGTGDDRDKILMEDSINWKYKDVFPKFKLKDGTPEFSYHLLSYKNNDSKENALIVLPGFSSKSRDWTFGRMNRFINQVEGLKIYSEIIILDFHEIKPLMNVENFGDNGEKPMVNFYKQNMDHVIAGHLNHILNKLGFSNYDVIGRSAGAGISLVLSSLNDRVTKLFLACPGWNEKGLELLIKKIKDGKDIKIGIYHSSKDTYINPEETKKLSDKLISNGIENIYKELNIDDKIGHAFHHRIYQDMIVDLLK